MSKRITISEYLSDDNQQKKEMAPIDILILILLSFYLFIDCFSISTIQDQLGLHWLLLVICNFVSGIFIFKYRTDILVGSTTSIFKNIISILYFIFFIIAGISIYVSINKVEGLITYSRLLTTVITFSTIAILLHKRLYLLKKLIAVIAAIVLAKSFYAIKIFYSQVGKIGLDQLIGTLQSSDGNKNIFAAALVVQIPIIIYGFFVHKKWTKYLCGISLGFAFMIVFIINARAAYLGLLLQLFLLLLGLIYLFYKEQKLKSFFRNAGIVLAIFLGSFFISQNSLNKAIQKDKTSVYGTFGNRLSTITDDSNAATSIRLEYWQHSFDLVKQRPLLGFGIGNWKLYSTTYTNTILNDNVFSKHPHNDFLEIAGETGIPNSIIYLSIFAFAFFVTLRILFSKRNHETKMISIFIFISLCGYFVDAFFNFPLERPHMQILFAFVLAILVVNYVDTSDLIENNKSKIIGKLSVILIVLCSTIGIYVHYTVLQSMKSQFLVDNDLNNIDNLPDALPQYTYAKVKKMFPSFPNIAVNSETIGYKEAKYLRKEKKYDEAIRILDSVHKFSPNIIADYYLKCNIYKDQRKIDSSYIYSKKAFYGKPRNFYYFRMASYLAAMKKDSTEVTKIFNLYNTYRKEQQAYSYYAQCVSWSGYDIKKIKTVVDDGLKLYPQDVELLKLKKVLP